MQATSLDESQSSSNTWPVFWSQTVCLLAYPPHTGTDEPSFLGSGLALLYPSGRQDVDTVWPQQLE